MGGRGKGGEEMGRGEVEKGGGSCVLAIEREQKRATAKSVAVARFPITRYC